MATDDRWDDAAAYERFMGRWSRRLAARLVDWLQVQPGRRWLEVGCGTGALTAAVLDRARPASLVAVDPAPCFVAHCASHLSAPGLSVREGSVDSLPVLPGGYDAVVSSLVLNFLPEPVQGLAAMRRACAPGGVVAAAVWDYAEGMELLRLFWDAAADADPRCRALDEGIRFPLCRPAALRDAFHEAGLPAVEVEPLSVETVFAGFDDLWESLGRGVGPAPAYLASLGPMDRHAVADQLRARLRGRDGEPIPLRARAWAARGTAPGG